MDAVLSASPSRCMARKPGSRDRSRMAAAARLQHRHRQGEGADGGSRLSERLRDDDCHSTWASPASTSRSACWSRKASAQIGIKATINKIPGANLAHGAEQEGAAALPERVLGLARLSRVFLHLVLSRQEFDLQHDELPVEGAWTRFDRRRGRCRRERRQGGIRKGRERLRRSRLQPTSRASRSIQPYSNVAMQKNMSGYQYWFHRRLDYRALDQG